MFSCVLKVYRVPTCCNYLCSSEWRSVILFPGCLPLFPVPAFLLALTSVSFQSFWAIEATRPRCNMPKASKTRKNIRCFATIDSDTSIYQSPLKQRKMTKTCANRDMSRAWRSFADSKRGLRRDRDREPTEPSDRRRRLSLVHSCSKH